MQEWLDAYAVSHQNPTNKLIHWICVPVIFITVIGLFSSIPFPFHLAQYGIPSPLMNWGVVVILLGLLFYLRLSTVMFLAMTLWCLFTLWVISLLNALPYPLWASSLVLFIIAWVGQFIGHKIEGEKPSFFEDLQFLMIGPAWLMSFILQKLKIPY